ncbi:MAG TPA: energy transducer TonB [Rhodanobacteraceae bacterium]|nr:energy transducer TonB [Rhodanobacteraceae bacterium]
MASLAVSRPFECAPHATRSLAMAMTLSLNLAIVLFALLPSTPHTIQALPPQSLFAVLLQPPPPVPPPTVPTLRVVKQVAAPGVHVAMTQPVSIAIPALPSIAPIATVQAATTAASTNTDAAAGDSNATLAYETATPPAYPIQALRAGVQGTVLLKVLVDPSGKPAQVMIQRSSGSRVLDDAARRHVLAAWRFHPAIRDGQAIEAWAVVPVRFNLDQG